MTGVLRELERLRRLVERRAYGPRFAKILARVRKIERALDRIGAR